MDTANNMSIVALEQNEYCVLRGSQYYNNSSFNIRIPKLMTNITKPMTDPFNRNILVNANSCKPSVDNSLYVKDYIRVKRSNQCSLHSEVVDKNGNVPDGLGVICLCMSGDYRNMMIVDSL